MAFWSKNLTRWLLIINKRDISSHKDDLIRFDLSNYGCFQCIYGRCLPICFPPSLAQTDSVIAVPLLYIISVQNHAWVRRKTLKRTTGARNTTHRNTENIVAGQAETASGVFPTNLRISAGSSRMKMTKLPYFILTSRRFISGLKNVLCFHLHLQLSWWRHDYVTSTSFSAKCARAHFTSKWPRPSHRPPQRRPTLLLRACIHYALGGEKYIYKIFWDRQTTFKESMHDKSSFGRLN